MFEQTLPVSETISVPADTSAVDVFTHSSTGFPGAWTEEEVNSLLDSWYEVIQDVRAPKRRSNAAYKVFQRLRKKGVRKMNEKSVRKQMTTLRATYKSYLSSEEDSNLDAKYLSKLEKILGSSASQLEQFNGSTSENFERSQVTSSIGESEVEDSKTSDQGGYPDAAETADEEGGRRRRVQGRVNIRKLAQLQQSILSEVQSLQKAMTEADFKIQKLLSEIAGLIKTSTENQERIVEALEALKINQVS